MKHFTIITDRFINCSFCSYLKLSITLLIRCACQDAKSVQPSIRPSYQTQCTKSVNVEKITTTSATILYNCLINLPLNRCIHAYRLWITTAVTTRTRRFTKHKPHASRQNPPHGSDGRGMVPSAAAWCYLQRSRFIPSLLAGDGSAQHVFVPGDLDLWPWQDRMSEGPNTSPCEFGTNLFGHSPDIWFTDNKTKNKKTNN